jgi:hypothetical protein
VPVEGRQGWRIREAILFGDYTTAGLDRSWTRGRDLRFNAYENRRRRQTFSFALMERGETVADAACTALLRTQGLHVRGVEAVIQDESGVDCTVRAPDGVWRLTLAESGERPLAGRIVNGERTWTVAGTNRIAGGRLPADRTTGYRIAQGEAALGAVEVINDGAVVMAPGLAPSDRTVLAAAAAILLLIDDLRAALAS